MTDINNIDDVLHIDILDDDDILGLDLDDVDANNNYNRLINKPKINNITLVGNKTSEDLNLQDKMKALSVTDIEKILYLDIKYLTTATGDQLTTRDGSRLNTFK